MNFSDDPSGHLQLDEQVFDPLSANNDLIIFDLFNRNVLLSS